MARHLFDCWTQVSARLRAARRVRLFLDFDGTLAPIRRTPEATALPAGTRLALGRLVRHGRVDTAIVSGRRRADLIRQVNLQRPEHLDHLEYWGMYGWERREGRALSADARRAVARARDRLLPRLARLPGVRVEDKAFGLSIHFRGAAPTAVRQARSRLTGVLAADGRELYVLTGDKTWNVLPFEVGGKGAAMRDALARARSSFLAIYVGDDATDEPAIAALSEGITVRVGAARGTRARFWVSNPRQVRRLIERLDGELA
jgi:trehalose-phosphatase